MRALIMNQQLIVPFSHPASHPRIHISFGRRFIALALGLVAFVMRCIIMRRHQLGKRVLILEPYGMGDVLSLQPLVCSLYQSGYLVTVCGRSPWESLIPSAWRVGWVNANVSWSGYSFSSKYANAFSLLSGFMRQVMALKSAASGAVGLDPRGDVRSVLLLRAAGCTRIISLSYYLGTDLPLFPGVAERIHAPGDLRRWELNLLFAKALGIKLVEQMTAPTVDYLQVRKLTGEGREIGLIPLAPWPGKAWVPERWIQLASLLRGRGFFPVSFCGPGQAAELSRVIGSACPQKTCNSVVEWLDHLSGLCAVVAVDTGPMHLADAMGLPTVVLAGSSMLPLWAPAGVASRVLQHQSEVHCAPCHQVGSCSESMRQCMRLISIDEVLSALSSAMGQLNEHS